MSWSILRGSDRRRRAFGDLLCREASSRKREPCCASAPTCHSTATPRRASCPGSRLHGLLAMIAATVALLVDHVTQRWQRDLSGQLTVELPVSQRGRRAAPATVDAARRRSRHQRHHRHAPADEAEVKACCSRWGPGDQLGVTLPDLVAARCSPTSAPTIGVAALQRSRRRRDRRSRAVQCRRAQFPAHHRGAGAQPAGLVLGGDRRRRRLPARAGLSIHRRIVEIVHLSGRTIPTSHASSRPRPSLRLHGRLPRIAAGAATLLSPACSPPAGRAMSAASRPSSPGDLAPRPIPLAAVLICNGDGPHRRAPGAAPDGI